MSFVHLIFILFSALLAAFGVWRYLPKAMLYIAPSSVSGTFREGGELRPKDREKVQEAVDDLSLLGFVPAGVQMEKLPLWSRSLKVLILTSRSGPEFACIIPTKRVVTWYFQTLFEDGAVVITADSGFKPANEGGLYQSIPEVEDAAALLERHRANVAHFVEEGHTPVKSYSADVIEGSTRTYYGFPAVRHGMRTFGSMNLVPLVIFFIPLIIALF